MSGDDVMANLSLKLKDPEFRGGVYAMIKVGASAYDPDVAGELVANELLSRI